MSPARARSVSTILAIGAALATAHLSSPPRALQAPGPGAAASDLRAIVALREYHATRVANGLQAPNRRHRLRTFFDPSGIRVVDRIAPGSPQLLALSVAHIGRDGTLRAVPPGKVSHERHRVEIARHELGLVEWFDNGPDGLEQGFTLERRPPGHDPLLLEIEVGSATVSDDGGNLVFRAEAKPGRRLRYAALRVDDAAGREIPARFALTDAGFRIEVDDASAVYPIVVDPLLTQAADGQMESDQDSGRLGNSVASAGDVNGDGFDDVIVGAKGYDAGEDGEGAAFVFHGSAAGIGGNPINADTLLEGDQPDAVFGERVAGIGDVNGDGYDDVAVGAFLYDALVADDGAVFVFHGGPGGIADTGAAAADTRIAGGASGTLLTAVAGAGDVNGDGYDDVIAGASGYSNGEDDEGGAFVFLGGAAGMPDGSLASADTRIESNQAGAEMGLQVASAGDVNADGYADVIVGALSYDAPDVDEGAAFIFHGGPAGISHGSPATADTQLESDEAGANFGTSVGSAGDHNGDGYADVLVGALDSTFLGGPGEVFLYYGGPGGIPDGGPTSADNVFVTGDGALGQGVAAAGDVNGDGFGDLVMGNRSADFSSGEVVVFAGEEGSGSPFYAGLRLPIPQPLAELGFSVASAGDVNGDGYDDVIAGAPSYERGQSAEGAAFVYYGGAAGIGDTGLCSTCNLGTTFLETTGAIAAGLDVAGAGDVNGDGFGDVIVGAPQFDAGAGSVGAAFLFHGREGGIPDGAASLTADTDLVSNQLDSQLGDNVGAAGDVNGDGYGDVIVGAQFYDLGQQNEGAAFLFLGGPTGIADGGPATADAFFEGDVPDARMGCSVTSAGDVNGDGFADLILGAQGFDGGSAFEGAAFVYLGSASGIPTGNPMTADTRLESNQENAFMGGSVDSAGDVNGDGYDDVIVGATGYDLSPSQLQEGAAFVFHGGPSGIADGDPSTAQATLAGEPVSTMGRSVAGAGDVNGDGYDDVIVGANRYMDFQGAVYLFLGGASGIAGSSAVDAHAQIDCDEPSCSLGRDVDGAGDVNGDGFADIVVVALDFPQGLDGSGIVSVFHGGPNGIASGQVDEADATVDFVAVDAGSDLNAARAGDVNGDGYADIAFGSPLNDLASIYHGRGGFPNPDGRLFGPRQLRGDGSGLPVQPGGPSGEDGFQVELFAASPFGRELGAIEVETCPTGAAFGDPGCVLQTGGFVDLGLAGSTLTETVSGLPVGERYSWRARVLTTALSAIDPGVAPPPRAGPWRRLQGRAASGDVRLVPVPEPGLLAGLLAGIGLLGVLRRARTRRLAARSAAALGVVMGLGGCAGPAPPRPAQSGSPVSDHGALAGSDVSLEASRSLLADVARREYHARRTPAGLQAPNRQHALRTFFAPSGIRVVDRTAPGSPELVALSLERVGREGGWQRVEPGEVTHTEARVEISRPGQGLVEWFDNGADGLEQGFTLSRRPPGDGRLRLEVAVGGASTTQAQEGLFFRARAAPGRRLRYAALRADDAAGRELPSRFTLTERGFRIEVEDAGAVYPIVVDPLLTGTADGQIEPDQDDARLGTSVASAGDVNGDGYDDVIVGAPGYDAGDTNEGAAFLFHGGPSIGGTPLNADTQLEGDQASANFGSQVASAGDVNGDGYDDVIVTAFAYDNGLGSQGSAFVFLGGPSGIADAGAASADTVLEADSLSSAASAGDVNGDGYADVVVGASFYANGESSEGGAFIFHGGPGGVANATQDTADTVLQSDQADARMGISVASAGDVNGDGYADVVVGAWRYTAGEANEGAAFIYEGGPGGIPDGNALDADTRLEGDFANSDFGDSVGSAGDLNGDGFSDVVIGAPDFGSTVQGRVFVYLGASTGILDGGSGDADFEISGAGGAGQNGTTAGDVNGDGYADLVYGEPSLDTATVWRGTPTGIQFDTFVAGQSASLFGWSVSAGDVNGDGYDDVIVGARDYDGGNTDEGAAFVYYGGPSGMGTSFPPQASSDLSEGAAVFQGAEVASAGDVNGDGYGDLIVGASSFDGGSGESGAAFVYLGGEGGLPSGVGSAIADTVLLSNQPFSLMGGSVSSAGDVNGDGYGDVIVGAFRYDFGQVDEGAAFLFHGGPSGIPDGGPATADAYFESDQAGAFLGSSVSSAGDVNGDGYADVLIGASRFDAGSFDEGAAFVFLGSPSGVPGGDPLLAHAWIESNQPAARLGGSLSSAGDVNGDGYGDVIVGSFGYDAPEVNEGAAFVFLGSAAGIPDSSPATAHAQLESNQAEAWMGESVASAGDVNGDGYDDVVVGASNYDPAFSEGAAFVFHGSASGIADGSPATADTWLDCDSSACRLGSSVAGVGDVNGDGYADVGVGAPGYLVESGVFEGEGAALVYHGGPAGIPSGDPDDADSTIGGDPGSALFPMLGGAGDVDGDGLADVAVSDPSIDLVLVFHGRGFVGPDGRPVVVRQLRGDGSGIPVQPGGASPGGFEVELFATTPFGRERATLEVEACPSGTAFSAPGCTIHTGTSYVDLGLVGATLTESVTGLVEGHVYSWRARVLSAPFFVTEPGVTPSPRRGPWRRLQGRASTSDVRVVPEPGVVGLLTGTVGLLALARRRRRRPE